MKNKNTIEEVIKYFENSPDYLGELTDSEYISKLEELQNNIDMIVSLLESPHKERFKYLTTWRSENESQS